MSKKPSRSHLTPILIFALCVLTASIGLAQTGNGRMMSRTDARGPRLSTVLRQAISMESRGIAADERIPVVVQLAEGVSARTTAARLGASGAVQELPIVNGFSARLTRAEIADLASADGVRFVSLDAVIRPTTAGFSAFPDDSPISVTTRGADLWWLCSIQASAGIPISRGGGFSKPSTSPAAWPEEYSATQMATVMARLWPASSADPGEPREAR
jgi:hypothetical protein